ncbi:arrestin domain-containing protein 3-like [Sander lucioperca]|uniref:arrestin domain-containing protein 3-like n=1 Tax=Sander lucioperca TaxID=283035 RepID=UPI00125D7924|nr:arrestin domain-containing protein 3-like [Sander lucioperca]
MSPIKDLCLTCEALNEEATFSEGDTVAGTLTFTLKKETKVKGVMVKAKGDANVSWSEGSGDNRRSYTAHTRYFKLKEYLVAENSEGTVLPQGVHCFKFRFKIPQGDMPSSFKGIHGKIVYMLEAKVSRGWLRCSRVQTELNFVSKSLSHLGQVMCPQSGSVAKEIGVFSKGQVQLSATVNTKVCSPGDTLSVVAKICNSSSKKVKPKFRLQQKTVYRASGSTNSSDQTLCKIVGETIALNSEKTVSCQLKIPADAIPTLHHCEIISVDHYLKVYLDISFAIDPEVVFPLVIVPSSFARPYPGEAVGPYSAGAPSYSDFPPPAFPIGPYPVPAGSGAYGYPAPDPTQNGTISGCNNQWPQQAPSYGFSTTASSIMQQQAPTAPPLVQQGEDPPSYMSLFYPSQDTLSRTGSEHKS